jgi:hypothetical protein
MMQKLHSILAISRGGRVIGCNRRIVKLQTPTALKSKATQVSPSEGKKSVHGNSAFHTAPISPSTTQRSLQLMAVLQPKQNQTQQQPWEPEAY